MQYKYHYFYITKNKENGKLYAGIHSTNDLNDGYIGSGKLLLRAIQKYKKSSTTETRRRNSEGQLKLYLLECP